MSAESRSADGAQGMTAAEARVRLEFLAELGYGLLESGQTSSQTESVLRRCADSLGLDRTVFNAFGRMLLLETALPDGTTVSVSGAARALDLIDCTRSLELSRVAARVSEAVGQAPSHDRLRSARQVVRRLRDTSTPWWAVTLGMTMLAFFISMQVGVTWQAWVTAAAVQLVASATGALTARLSMPRLFAIILQASIAGAFATMLVQIGFVSPVGAAAAIAVNWLLLIPLPQVIGAVTDAIASDFLSALSRVASVGIAALGIFVGGAFTFALGEVLGMEHPRLDALPSLPWYLVLVFSALGAIANGFANGGRLPLVAPAAALGVATGAANQVLLALDLPALWANSLAAAVLGVLVVIVASRTGFPQQVLALVGITGALLPGIPVFFGILQEMGSGSGAAYFGTAAAISLGLGTGVTLGIYLAGLFVGPRDASSALPR